MSAISHLWHLSCLAFSIRLGSLVPLVYCWLEYYIHTNIITTYAKFRLFHTWDSLRLIQVVLDLVWHLCSFFIFPLVLLEESWVLPTSVFQICSWSMVSLCPSCGRFISWCMGSYMAPWLQQPITRRGLNYYYISLSPFANSVVGPALLIPIQ